MSEMDPSVRAWLDAPIPDRSGRAARIGTKVPADILIFPWPEGATSASRAWPHFEDRRHGGVHGTPGHAAVIVETAGGLWRIPGDDTCDYYTSWQEAAEHAERCLVETAAAVMALLGDVLPLAEVEPWPEREMRRAGSLGMVRAYPQNAAEWEERCLAYEAAHNRALTKQHALLREVLSLEAELRVEIARMGNEVKP